MVKSQAKQSRSKTTHRATTNGGQGTVPYIHNLDTWRVVAFIPQPL